jgi:hypothetical protein
MRDYQPVRPDVTMSEIGKKPACALQPLRAKDFLEPRMYPNLILGNEKGQQTKRQRRSQPGMLDRYMYVVRN